MRAVTEIRSGATLGMGTDTRTGSGRTEKRRKNARNTHTYTHPPWEDQNEWHRTIRMTGPDCAVMCNLIHTHTHIHTQPLGRINASGIE